MTNLQTPGYTTVEVISRLQWDRGSTPSRTEKRQSYRLQVREPAELLVPTADQSTTTRRATILDVSTGGLGLVVFVPVSVGTEVVIRCRFGLAVGVVRRCVDATGLYVCGIAFDHYTSCSCIWTELITLARRQHLAGHRSNSSKDSGGRGNNTVTQ